MKKEKILVFSAHSDDFVIGAGGTIANYAKEKKKVTAVIFSYGELSHPWLKEEVVQKTRIEETYKAAKLLHNELIFLGLREGKFKDSPEFEKKILEIVEKEKPTKIFTHSGEDPHPDHRAVHKVTLDVYEKLKVKPEIYIYSVWNPVSFKTKYPSFYVDVTKTFFLKLKALKKFQSQIIHVAYPFLLLLYRGIKDGFKIGKRFGEHFFRIK